jgi:hypothetical protein
MPKPRPKITKTRPTKEVSVMAWIEDAEQKVLLVRQAVGLRLWPSKEGWENSGFNSSVPTDRVNETDLYHVKACS